MKINILDFFMATLQIAFIVLKICGVINWSWWVVLIPIILFCNNQYSHNGACVVCERLLEA